MDENILTLRIKGTCVLEKNGSFENLKDHFLKKVTEGPQVVKVYQTNPDIRIEDLPGTEVDSSINLKSSSEDDGEMTVRFLTKIGTNNANLLIYDQDSKSIENASGNAEYVRKLYFNYKVSSYENGLKIDVVQETRLEKPGIAPEDMFIEEASKSIQKSFEASLKEINQEVSENI
jgi:hypothetical protein